MIFQYIVEINISNNLFLCVLSSDSFSVRDICEKLSVEQQRILPVENHQPDNM